MTRLSTFSLLFCAALSTQAEPLTANTKAPKEHYEPGMVVSVKAVTITDDGEANPGPTLAQFVTGLTGLTLDTHRREHGLIRWWTGEVAYSGEGFIDTKDAPGEYIFAAGLVTPPVKIQPEPKNRYELLEGYTKCHLRMWVDDKPLFNESFVLDSTADSVDDYARFCGLSKQMADAVQLDEGLYPVSVFLSCLGSQPRLSERQERFPFPKSCINSRDTVFLADRNPADDSVVTIFIKRPTSPSAEPSSINDFVHRVQKPDA